MKFILLVATMALSTFAQAKHFTCLDAAHEYKVELKFGRGDNAVASLSKNGEAAKYFQGRFIRDVRNNGNHYGPAPVIVTYTLYVVGNVEVGGCKVQTLFAQSNPNVLSADSVFGLLQSTGLNINARCNGNPVIINKNLKCYLRD